MDISNCKGCGRPIEFRLTVKGRSMPVDPGKVALLTPRGTVIHGWVSHFCTCGSGQRYLPGETRIVQRRFVPS